VGFSFNKRSVMVLYKLKIQWLIFFTLIFDYIIIFRKKKGQLLWAFFFNKNNLKTFMRLLLSINQIFNKILFIEKNSMNLKFDFFYLSGLWKLQLIVKFIHLNKFRLMIKEEKNYIFAKIDYIYIINFPYINNCFFIF